MQKNTFGLIDSLEAGFFHLAELIRERLQTFMKPEEVKITLYHKDFEDYQNDVLQRLIREYKMSDYEAVMLLISLAPVFHPELMEVLISSIVKSKVSPGVIGGITREPSRTFIPTCRTVSFILNEESGITYSLFSPEHFLFKNSIIEYSSIPSGIPLLDMPLSLSDEYYYYFTTGKFEPRHSEKFPAKKTTTELSWSDLVVRKETLTQIEEISGWLRFEKEIMDNVALTKKITRGYRALFYGKSGTGKTLTASLLGKTFGRLLYRVDLSMIVSKYVGETEKNLEKVFNMAEGKGWILFFDEAEALFGKRGSGGSANDRYANQEVSYLLQRIEDYDGIIILASNRLFDIDEAFTRRFQSIIEFPEPNAEERFILWNKTFEHTGFIMDSEVDIKKLADNHAITGGMLVNVLRFCAIKVMERGDNTITMDMLVAGLKKEYAKERKMWVETPVKTTVSRVQMNGKIN